MKVTPQLVDKVLRNPIVLLSLAALGGLGGIVVLGALAFFFSDFVKWMLATQWAFTLLFAVVSLLLIVHFVPACILFERKIASYIQDRVGPNRVGWWGLLQPIADGLKFLLKEDIIPRNVDRPLYLLAPALAMGISLLGWAIIPWAGEVVWPWMPPDAKPITTQVAPLNVGFLYLLAVGSMGVYGVVLAGYASNNKYSFYGGMRSTAQMLSYEVPLGLGLLAMLLTAGTLRLDTMVDQQTGGPWPHWYVFYHPLAFLLVIVAGYAETNRTPFDLAEAEQELVGGYHTEYSAMKFAMFFLAEYIHMITNSALVVAVFFGGWHFWGLSAANHEWWAFLLKLGVFWAKIALFLWLYMQVRWTLPRYRFDQLMRITWQGLTPIGVGLVLGIGLLVAFGLEKNWYACIALNLAILVVVLLATSRSTRRVTGRQEHLPDIAVVRPA